MNRMERVNEQIKRAIGQIIQEDLNDPRLAFVSIVHVEVSKDLRNGKVFFSVLGGDSQAKSAQQALERAASLIRRELGRRIEMRYTPELIFRYDSSIQESVKLENKIREIHDEHS